MSTLGERARSARWRRFVGRVAELNLFVGMLDGAVPVSVLFVHGPGGVGKSMLLGQFARIAGDRGVSAATIDLAQTNAAPAAVLDALSRAAGFRVDLDAPTDRADSLPRVILFDTYERAGPIDGWIRDELLPRVSAGSVVVLAGRDSPPPGWLDDPGWRALSRVVSLRNLAPEEASELLRVDGVPEALHERALMITHGHPLALGLVAELASQRGAESLPTSWIDEPGLLSQLLRALLDQIPSEAHRHALHACALARSTTLDLLRAALETGEVDEVFAWLRERSFVEQTPHGVTPHDLARDLLAADLRWRDPTAHQHLHRRIYEHLAARVRATQGAEHRRLVMDWNFLLRSNPFTSAFIDWDTYGDAFYDHLRAGDHEPAIEIAERWEGAESSALVAHWLERQPAAFRVVRTGSDELVAFGAVLALHEASSEDITHDPGAAAMWSYAQRHRPPRPGEGVFASRFYMDRHAYQGPSPAYSAIVASWTDIITERRHASWEFLGFWADPERIAPFMAYIDFERVPEADYEVGGRSYGVFAHDWRRMGVPDWLETVARRQAETGFDAVAAAPRGSDVATALSADEFAGAAHEALRNLNRRATLAENPLVRSRLVIERCDDDPPGCLRELLVRAIAAVGTDPRAATAHRVLDRTYLHPARTQELAAEALDLPMTTYKRHLRRGIEAVTAWLWERELYGDDDPPSDF